MKNPIARIKLAMGNVGWFDSLTNIHLTMQRPIGFVLEGMNCENIHRGIQFGTIVLVDGSLEPSPVLDVQPAGPEIHVTEEPMYSNQYNEEVLQEIAEEIIESQEVALMQEVVEETPAVEEVPAVEEAPVVEEKPKKKTTKKKAAKKEEVTPEDK